MSTRILGIYLVIISTLQLALYTCLYTGMAGDIDWLTYQVLDPRTFWSMIEQSAVRTDPTHFTIVGFVTAFWVLAIGISFILGRARLAFLYISSEIILGIPQLFLAVPWGLLMVSEGEGVLKGFSPVSLVFFFTVVPVSWAVYLAIYGKSDKAN